MDSRYQEQESYPAASNVITFYLVCAGLLRALRPDAVALVDSFGLSDYLLNSALGKYDGDVYNDLLRRAKVRRPTL
jgi:hypothetical protein